MYLKLDPQAVSKGVQFTRAGGPLCTRGGMALTVTGGRWRSLVIVLMLLLISQVAQALVSEAVFLLQFKSAVIDRQANLVDWDTRSSADPCFINGTWYGVTCSPPDNQGNMTVTDLDLSSFSLRGSISEALSGLENLQGLDLSYNFFDGLIPDSILDFKKLWYLDLSNNQLTGPIPKLPLSLTSLYLSSNSLDGDIDVDSLFNSKLQYLDLHSNQLTGTLPDKFKEYPLVEDNLLYLDLSQNQIEGLLPTDFGGVGIAYIDLSANKFVGGIPEQPWDFLYYLDLSGNELRGSIPSKLFSSSADPTYLNLSGNSFSGSISFKNSTLTRIQFIDLSLNVLENELDLEIGNGMAETLEFLLLQNNRFSGSLDWIFRSNFSVLRELRLDGNQFQGGELASVFSSAGASFPFPHLQVMNISGSGLVGEVPSELFQSESLPSLKILDLSNNSLSGTIPITLSQMPSLLELRLQNNSLERGIYAQEAGNWTHLEVLDLRNNSFQFDGMEIHLGAALSSSYLRELRLGGSNRFNRAALPAILGNVSLLEILDLSRCNLEGTIREEYSRNDRFPSLKILDLSHNFLKGSLPKEFGEMPLLIELDVSYNSLSGRLPYLPFPLLNSSFFSENPGLCGPPLQECPSGSSGLTPWEVVIIVIACVGVSGGSCLLLGWVWSRKIVGKKHEQDRELLAALLDTDSTASLMHFRELRRSTGDFCEENKIGAGGFGTVYRGILDDGTEVAIKRSKGDCSSSVEKRLFLNEVKLLSKVKHPYLVRLLGCCLTNRDALLVFEFVENGTLQEHLNKRRGASPLSWEKRLRIGVQTADALDYLHTSLNPPIYHLDVKSANILLDRNLDAKVADFGISKLAPNVDATHITALGIEGTPGYMDPEAVVDPFLTDKCDVYAFGVVLLELITATPAVDYTRGEDASLVKWVVPLVESGTLEEIIDQTISATFGTPYGRHSMMAVAGLAARCLRFHSVKRPSMKEVWKELLFIEQEFEVKNST